MRKDVVLFLVKGDSVLLAMKKRGLGAGRWNGPGGKVEANETFTSAVIRECEEEIRVTPLKPKAMARLSFKVFYEDSYHDLDVRAFTCSKWKGNPAETDEMKPRWFKQNKLPFNKMWPDDPYWLPNILKDEKVQGYFHFDKHDKIIEYKIKSVSKVTA